MLNFFQHKTGIAQGAVAQSNTFVATAAGTLTVSKGVIVKNGIEIGTTSSVIAGDSLSLKSQVSLNPNEGDFVTYSFGGDVGAWGVSSQNLTEYSYQFSFTDIFELPINSVVDSNAVVLYRLNAPVFVVVPNVLSAKIIKNGVDVGTSTMASNGDELKLRFTTPSSFNTPIYLPMFIGGVVDVFDTKTVIQDVHPAIFDLPQTRGSLGAAAQSSVITISGLGPGVSVPFNVSGGATLVKNSVDSGLTTTSVVNGDQIYLKSAIPLYSLQSKIHTVTCGDYETYWVVTANEVAKHYHLRAQDQEKYLFDTAFVPNNGGNALRNLTDGTSFSFGAPTNAEDQADHLFVSDRQNSCLYVMGLDGSTLFKKTYAANAYPEGLTYFPKSTVSETVVSFKYLVLNGLNQVVKLDPANAYNIAATYNVGIRPHGIDATGGYAYVACDEHPVQSTKGCISMINLTTGVVTNHAVEGRPIAVLCIGNMAYVLSAAKGAMEGGVLYELNDVQSPVGVTLRGKTPYALCADAQKIYIAQAFDNEIEVRNLTTKAFVEAFKVLSIPNSLVLRGTVLYVGHYGTNIVLTRDLSNGTQTEISGVNTTYGLVLEPVSNKVWAVNLYANAPTLAYPKELGTFVYQGGNVTDVALAAAFSVGLTTTVTRPTLVEVPTSSVLKMFVNAVEVASTTIKPGDTGLSITAKNSSYHYEDFKYPLVVNGQVITHQRRTIPNLVPNKVYFGALYNIEVDQIVESNSVTIDGLTPGFTATIEYQHTQGALIVNGEQLDIGETAVVQNGDQIRLKSQVMPPYGTPSVYNLRSNGQVFGSLKLVSIQLEGAVKGRPENVSPSDYTYDAVQVPVASTGLVNIDFTPDVYVGQGVMFRSLIPVKEMQAGRYSQGLFTFERQESSARLYEGASPVVLKETIKLVENKGFIRDASIGLRVGPLLGFLKRNVYNFCVYPSYSGKYSEANFIEVSTRNDWVQNTQSFTFKEMSYDKPVSVYTFRAMEYVRPQQDERLIPMVYSRPLQLSRVFRAQEYSRPFQTARYWKSQEYVRPFELSSHWIDASYIRMESALLLSDLQAPVVYNNNLYETEKKTPVVLTTLKPLADGPSTKELTTVSLVPVTTPKQYVKSTSAKLKLVEGKVATTSRYVSPRISMRYVLNSVIVEEYGYATLAQRGLFATEEEAEADAIAKGALQFVTYQFDGGWFWKTPVSGISCTIPLPPITNVIGGYVSGG